MMARAAAIPSVLLQSVRRAVAQEDPQDTEADTLECGLLLGVGSPREKETQDEDAEITIWGLLRSQQRLGSVNHHLPAGVKPIGLFSILHSRAAAADAAVYAQRVIEQAGAHGHDSIVLLYARTTDAMLAFQVTEGGASVTELELRIVECLHARDFLRAMDHTLLRCAFNINVTGKADEPNSMIHKIQLWTRRLQQRDQTYFRIANGSSIFNGDALTVNTNSSSSSTLTLDSVLNGSKKSGGSAKKKSKSKAKKSAAQQAMDAWDDEDDSTSSGLQGSTSGFLPSLEYGEIANVELLYSLDPEDDEEVASSPVVMVPSCKSSADSHVHVRCDVMALLSLQTPLTKVLDMLRTQLLLQLDQLIKPFQRLTESKAQPFDAFVGADHFALVGAAFPLTLASARLQSDAGHITQQQGGEEHEVDAKTLLELFFQPLHQPRFAPRCSLTHQAETLRSCDVLINVHEGIPNSHVTQGQQYMVKGFYGYYHYMQQQVNDKGWGCAYRSLQTLASWLVLNQYTEDDKNAAPLTHLEIQQTLVRMGDKPASFLKSREWIGSVEVGYVLDEKYGISCRSMYVASGAQLVEKAQELKHHFQTQGAPVMMGGANLAFTLLGIDYNEFSGECAFLILDPHYTGSENLETIQRKAMQLEGYKAIPCGWRKASSFAKNSFYNLCLPQRPSLA